MSFVLRHGLVKLNLKPTTDGYIRLASLLAIPEFSGVTEETILEIVQNDAKTRFSLKQEGDELWIRANQGHSRNVGELLNDDELLEEIKVPLPICVHGTFRKFISFIETQGLKTQSRKHIHLAPSLDAGSGLRKNAEVLVFIDMAKAMNDGIKFYKSANNVILTDGKDGVLEVQYFEKIQHL